jgi:putative membrane protein
MKEQATGETSLSAERTRLSYERTMMSWIRTATTLITFGFTLYKFFQIELAGKTPPPRRAYAIGPTHFALAMVIIGLLALLMGTWEHRRQLKSLRAQYPNLPHSLSMLFAACISILGLLALATIIFRQ